MIDPFLLAHHELNTMEPSDEKQRFKLDTITRASKFASFPIALPSSHHLTMTMHAQTHEKIFEMHIATTNVAYMMRLSPIEHLLFEIIFLHKLMCQYEHEGAESRDRRSRNVLGCMIQHRLTQLLIDVYYAEIEKIFLLGRASGIDQQTWEAHFIGAAACARTVGTFLELDDCRLYFPTVVEDCLFGIDLIVLNEKYDDWCISIKAGLPNRPMYIEHVHTRPHDQDPAYRSEGRRRIYDGSQEMEKLFGGTFHACRIVVGKLNRLPYDLNVYDEDVDRIRAFVESDRTAPFVQREQWPQESHAHKNSNAA